MIGLEQAKNQFLINGFTKLDLLEDFEIQKLRDIGDALETAGIINYSQGGFGAVQDAIFLDPFFEELVKDDRIVTAAKTMLNGAPINLQHSKLTFKSNVIKSSTNISGLGIGSATGLVKWHQDFPFYPHTNFDLVSVGIHFDSESDRLGALAFVPKSHKQGPYPHTSDGIFQYRFTGEQFWNSKDEQVVTGNKGFISFHHGLTLHSSAPKTQEGPRRILIFQYRAQDAVKLAGPIWKSTGYQVEREATPSRIRLEGGITFDNRGANGKLYDVYGVLQPKEELEE